jgi:pyrimidine deaminase RibD-like protein
MLIHEKLPPGHIYPQITQFSANYIDFLAAFHGGQTIDNNLTATSIASTPQAQMLNIAIASGHLTKKGNPIQGEALLDIFLTEEGAEQILTPLDKQFCKMAVELARKSKAEDDGEPHPCVGAVVVRDSTVISTGYRGETGEGRHAEYCALRKINDDVDNVDLSGCTVYTSLEPCSQRSPKKKACADRLIKAKVERVVFGMADKDESVYGHVSLTEAGIDVALFPKSLIQELIALNKAWSETRRKPEVVPPPNRDGCLAYAQYYKPGTSMLDNIQLIVRPPKDAGGYFTVEDNAYNVVAYARTFDEIAVKWHALDAHKRLVEKMQRVKWGNNADQRLGFY